MIMLHTGGLTDISDRQKIHPLPGGRRTMVRHYCIERQTDHQPVEIDAAYLEREGDEWVFYAGFDEVFRIPVQAVAGISKAA
jgi:hypothetical protein